MELIKMKKVCKTYPNGVHAVYDLDLTVDKGEFVFIIGSSGSGKTRVNDVGDHFLPEFLPVVYKVIGYDWYSIY